MKKFLGSLQQRPVVVVGESAFGSSPSFLPPRFLSTDRKESEAHLSFRVRFSESVREYYGLSHRDLSPRLIFPLSSSSSSSPSSSLASSSQSIKNELQREIRKQFPILKYIPHTLSLSSSGNAVKMESVSDELSILRQFNKIVISQEDFEVKHCEDEDLLRIISFYHFFPVSKMCQSPQELLFKLKAFWRPLQVKGRVYVAEEGINAQIGVPSSSFSSFIDFMRKQPEFNDVEFNEDLPVSPSIFPFPTLDIRVREKIVADGGLDLDWTSNSGKYLEPEEWDKSLSMGYPILDCRNDYEYEVGHFTGAEPLKTNTFRETWGALLGSSSLKNLSKEHPVMIYCTGGIRCEKVGAFLEQEMGFKEVRKLRGGIVAYHRHVLEKGEKDSSFEGINYVFDNRLTSRISSDVISQCDQCGVSCDTIKNCRNANCGVRFIECGDCSLEYDGYCSYGCFLQSQSLAHKKEPNSFDFPLLLSTTDQTTHPPPTLHPPFQNAHLNLLLDSAIHFSFPSHSTPNSPPTSPPAIPHKPALDSLLFPTSPTNMALDWAREQVMCHYPFAEKMASCSKQCLFLSCLVQLLGARKVLDVGGFVGCSAVSLARGFGENGGEVFCVEKDKQVAKIAQGAFNQVEKKEENVKFHLIEETALDSLTQMTKTNEKFDFVFVDCDKKGYQQYYHLLFGGEVGGEVGVNQGLLNDGGIVVFDNVLWKGKVAEIETNQSPTPTQQPVSKHTKRHREIAESLHKFLKKVRNDPRTECSLLPVRDGLLLVKRKGSMRTKYRSIAQILNGVK